MEDLTICYEFNFNVAISRRKGKQQNRYAILATGITYSLAVFDMYLTLKKRGCTLIKINSVSVNRLAFAFDKEYKTVQVTIADHPAQIPADLNEELNHLPKKQAI